LLHSLDQKGFVRWDEDKERKIVYIKADLEALDEEDEGGGFIDWLFFWRDKDDKREKKPKYPMKEVLTHLESSPEVVDKFGDLPGVDYGKELKGAEGYLVSVSVTGETVNAIIRNYRGKKLPADEAKNMLRVIRRNLI